MTFLEIKLDFLNCRVFTIDKTSISDYCTFKVRQTLFNQRREMYLLQQLTVHKVDTIIQKIQIKQKNYKKKDKLERGMVLLVLQNLSGRLQLFSEVKIKPLKYSDEEPFQSEISMFNLHENSLTIICTNNIEQSEQCNWSSHEVLYSTRAYTPHYHITSGPVIKEHLLFYYFCNTALDRGIIPMQEGRTILY